MTPKLQKVHFGNFTPSFISPKCPSQFKRHYPRREREKKVLKFWRHLPALSRLRLIEAKGFEFEDVMGIVEVCLVVFQPFFWNAGHNIISNKL